MKQHLTIIFGLLIFSQAFSQELENIQARLNKYEESIEEYKTSEMWGIWTMPIGKPFASSFLNSEGTNNYAPGNLSDYNLNTAWIEGKSDFGIGESFGFEFDFPENTVYGGAYQFYGIVNLFNGYCKSLKTWEQNSRVKRLAVFYNDHPVCIVDLLDTWHFQTFDIGKFFKYRSDKKHMDAPYKIIQGDKLRFEILEVFPGTKYSDVALTEFMAEGAGN